MLKNNNITHLIATTGTLDAFATRSLKCLNNDNAIFKATALEG